jgi:anti-sigma B factor antagonist
MSCPFFTTYGHSHLVSELHTSLSFRVWFDLLRAKSCVGKERTPLLDDTRDSARMQGINIISNENGALASLYGRVDIDSSPAMRIQLLALFETPHSRNVSIDLSGVTHIDSSGIATLIEAQKIAQGYQIELRLQGLHDELLRLFKFTGVLALFGGSARS